MVREAAAQAAGPSAPTSAMASPARASRASSGGVPVPARRGLARGDCLDGRERSDAAAARLRARLRGRMARKRSEPGSHFPELEELAVAVGVERFEGEA